jgi:hypothetical protein
MSVEEPWHMTDPDSRRILRMEIRQQVDADRVLLYQLRDEIRPLRSDVRRIQPRTAIAISPVGTDGSNNSRRLDPFLVQIARAVDSSSNELCLEVVIPTTSVHALAERQLAHRTAALGRTMEFLVRPVTVLTAPVLAAHHRCVPGDPSEMARV